MESTFTGACDRGIGTAGGRVTGTVHASDRRVLSAILEHQANLYGDRPFLHVGEDTWTFVDACEIASRFAGALAALGIEPRRPGRDHVRE